MLLSGSACADYACWLTICPDLALHAAVWRCMLLTEHAPARSELESGIRKQVVAELQGTDHSRLAYSYKLLALATDDPKKKKSWLAGHNCERAREIDSWLCSVEVTLESYRKWPTQHLFWITN